MKSTPITVNLQNGINKIYKEQPAIRDLVEAINAQGGRALLVGGAVRDMLLGRESKDIDIEVHGLTIEQLEKILKAKGPVSTVGKSFGVLRLHSLDVDWSLPRADSVGRKPIVEIDPNMSIERAFERRDLTINAMGIDLMTGELLDPFNGKEDLEKGVLRAPNTKTFLEDPLRFYRVMQFIARFDMYPDDTLQELCKTMSIENVSRERIESEFEKMLLKSERPSRGIRWLKDIGRLKDVLPELAATVGIEQDPRWHPEGDVFEHTMQALDGAAAIARTYDNRHFARVLMYAALCHDLGKDTTTQKKGDAIISHGHELESVKRARTLLKRITYNQDIKDAVLKLVRYHMAPVAFVKGKAKPPAYKRLANKLAPDATLALLADLAYADKRGRNPNGPELLMTDIPEIDTFLQHAEKARVKDSTEEPVLHGRDLLGIVEPGKRMGELLKQAYEIQIEEGIIDKDELKKRVLK